MISSFANEESYKELFFFKFGCIGFSLQIFMYRGGGGAPTVRFAPVVPWAKTGPADRNSKKSFLS
jgi:hypothetical protein